MTKKRLNPDEIDPEDRRWVEAEVARTFARKRADEATWPLETDFDRVAIAFDALDARAPLGDVLEHLVNEGRIVHAVKSLHVGLQRHRAGEMHHR